MIKLTNDQCRATEDIHGLIRALAETGIIEIRNHEFLARQFGLLRGGHIGADLSGTMLTLVDALRRCSVPAPTPAPCPEQIRACKDAQAIARCVASRLAEDEEWEYLVRLKSGGEHMEIKLYGDGDGCFDVSIADSTEYTGWRTLWPNLSVRNRPGTGWRDDTEGLASWLLELDPRDGITWERC